MDHEVAAALKAFGFTDLEAGIYAVLLEEAPLTGYRLARTLGKSAANTYLALESLAAKGAVILADGRTRQARPVEWRELLARLKRDFERSCARAEGVFARLPEVSVDDRVYELRDRAQILEKARAMLGTAGHFVLAHAFPGVVSELSGALTAAAARGIEVIVKVYAPADLTGVKLILREPGDEITRRIPGDLLSVNADGGEHLLAFLRPEGGDPYQAFWTRGALLCSQLYDALMHEIVHTLLKQAIRGGDPYEKLVSILDETFHLNPISAGGPVYQNLMRRYGLEAGGPAPGLDRRRTRVSKPSKSAAGRTGGGTT